MAKKTNNKNSGRKSREPYLQPKGTRNGFGKSHNYTSSGKPVKICKKENK